MPSPTRFVRAGLVGPLIVAAAVAGCASEPPEVPVGPDGTRDPVLVIGREVYGDHCANCHDSDGGGGRGPMLKDGSVLEAYPDPLDQIRVVTEGKAQMPSFLGQLSGSEIEAVVRYTREVLG